MGPNPIAILSIATFITAAAADVTLYNVVDPTPTIQVIEYESATLSAVGVDSGGSTTYIGTGVESLIVASNGVTTQTLLSTPIPITGTLVEDKSGFHDGSDALSCTFMAGGNGACVGVHFVPVFTGVSASTYTFSGSAVPWTTTRDPGPTAASNGAVDHFPSILVVIFLPVAYLVL
ncbi:hypothetical protein BD779DRAFT_1681484 [Infundibulicybe gibba]|nr:hypothetical protein BD779DRAFT_1681484 [Infundibulicybe gibba]